jgi:hypothetical protein
MADVLSATLGLASAHAAPSEVFRSELKLNPVDVPLRAASIYPEKIAVVDGERRYRYRQLVSQRGADGASPPRAQGRRPSASGAAPAAPCARRPALHEGIPLPLIQRQLGHSHLSTTGTHLHGVDTEGDHLDGSRAGGSDDARQRRPRL